MHTLSGAVADQIMDELKRAQGDRTDEEFAAVLGVHRVHWLRLRLRQRQPSYALVKRAAALFPALYPIVARDLFAEPEEAAV